MNRFFREFKGNFGFGCMRLPMNGEQVDLAETQKMVDAFLEAGFNYFDTAHGYISGQSETALRECLTSRYPRDRYIFTNKLSFGFFEKEEEIRPLFEKQLQQCGVEYFDFYLMHALSASRHEKYTQTRAYDIAQELKAEGKIRHVGMSFHDTADVLDKILTDRPEIVVVQLQFNYVDFEDPKVQSRACYEVCQKHGKPVLVMEPVKGGSLVNLPEEAKALLPAGSPASYAIRFAASFEDIAVVLSGMSNLEQMEDNLSFMKDFKPLTEAEYARIKEVRTLFQAQHKIPCTACRYCTDGCPASIDIPELFKVMNEKLRGEALSKAYRDFDVLADACVECGQCEGECPQNLSIRQRLKEVHNTLG